MRLPRLSIVVLLAIGALGCSPAFWGAVAEGYAAGYEGTSARLMIFGGRGHDTYLGCLSCSEYESDSIFNRYGSYWNPYSSDSIFNQYRQFGSRYSQYSACNPYASDPPVVVDEDGGYYGRLTVNRYNSDAFGDAEIIAWLQGVCQ